MTNSLLQYRYCFTAGAFAAGGSFFGRAPNQLAEMAQLMSFFKPETTITYCLELLLLRICPLALMLLCNILNWRYYLKALQCAEQTLTATVLTAATNYMFSFILGAFIYGEQITSLSSLGVIIIVAGLWVLCKAQAEQKIKDGQKKQT